MNDDGSRTLERLIAEDTGRFLHVFVAAPAEVADNNLLGRHLPRALHRIGDAVRGLKRGHNAFDRAQCLERIQRLRIGQTTNNIFDLAFPE